VKAVYDPVHAAHDPRFFLVRGVPTASTEQPERADRLLSGLEKCGISVISPDDFGPDPRAAVHSPEYLRFLETAHAEWSALPGASEEIIPNIHPLRLRDVYPDHIVGRAGWHMMDTACPIGVHTFDAACASANSALSAAQMVLDGDGSAYALCRPPGHHAFADMAGGFCFLNNCAIAAQHLRTQHDRVAILDVDVHHGNGTQGIFYERGDVMTVSIHTDPNQYYPFYWGHASERGLGDGEGYNLNLPLPVLSGDQEFLAVLDKAANAIQAFNPGALVVALGLDASESDPLQGMSITTPGFHKIGSRIGKMGYPTLYVQEGGYLSDVLGDNLSAFLSGTMDS
jgi:acetoin utilization deacetylase AcuC-like enzyme